MNNPPTKISLICQTNNIVKKSLFDDFYCKENAFEVLKKFSPEYLVHQYKNLEVNSIGLVHQNDNGIYLLNGLKIEEFKEGNLRTDKSLKSFNFRNIPYLLTKENFDKFVSMDFVISSYLIDKEIEKAGSATNTGGITQVSEMGRYNLVNLLTEKTPKAEEAREKYLENILEYGTALFGEFSQNDLEKLTEKVISKTSTEFEPHPQYFAMKAQKSGFWGRRLR